MLSRYASNALPRVARAHGEVLGPQRARLPNRVEPRRVLDAGALGLARARASRHGAGVLQPSALGLDLLRVTLARAVGLAALAADAAAQLVAARRSLAPGARHGVMGERPAALGLDRSLVAALLLQHEVTHFRAVLVAKPVVAAGRGVAVATSARTEAHMNLG